jgi:hypothetical protein
MQIMVGMLGIIGNLLSIVWFSRIKVIQQCQKRKDKRSDIILETKPKRFGVVLVSHFGGRIQFLRDLNQMYESCKQSK